MSKTNHSSSKTYLFLIALLVLSLSGITGLGYGQLYPNSFPPNCAANQYMYGITRSSNVCSQVGYNQLDNFPSACPTLQFVSQIQSTPVCQLPPQFNYTGLEGYWPLSEQTSGVCTNTVYDLSGNGNNGVCVNSPTYTSGPWGTGSGALSFNAANSQYFKTSSAPAITSQITISVWIYMTSVVGMGVGGQYESIIFSGNGAGYCASGYFGVHYSTDGTTSTEHCATSTASNNALVLNAWAMYTATYDGTTYRGYINGVQTFAVAGPQFYTNLGQIWVASSSFGGYSSEKVADVRIYNYALSPSQVLQSYRTIPYPFETQYQSLGNKNPAPQTVITGTTAGTATCEEPFQESTYKVAVCYLNGYENTGTTAQTYTYPAPFTYAPLITGIAGTTSTTTTLSLPTSMSSAVTGWVEASGW